MFKDFTEGKRKSFAGFVSSIKRQDLVLAVKLLGNFERSLSSVTKAE